MIKHYPAKLSVLYEILDDIEDFARLKKFTDKKIHQLRLIAEELIVNVINYAYENKDGQITLKLESETNNEIEMQIIDSGKKFNPLLNELPDTNKGLNSRTPGGLGIFMAKNLSDKLDYEYKEDKNILKVLLRNDL